MHIEGVEGGGAQREKARQHILKDRAGWPDCKKSGLTRLFQTPVWNSLQAPSALG